VEKSFWKRLCTCRRTEEVLTMLNSLRLQSSCNKWDEPVNWCHTYYQYVSQNKLFYTINGLSEDLGDEHIRNGRSKFHELAVYELLIWSWAAKEFRQQGNRNSAAVHSCPASQWYDTEIILFHSWTTIWNGSPHLALLCFKVGKAGRQHFPSVPDVRLPPVW